MYIVANHKEEFGHTVEHTKICDLGKMGKYEAQLWEHTFCGFHFLFTIQYSSTEWADYVEKEFFSAATALRWFRKEQERRKHPKRRYQRNRN